MILIHLRLSVLRHLDGDRGRAPPTALWLSVLREHVSRPRRRATHARRAGGRRAPGCSLHASSREGASPADGPGRAFARTQGPILSEHHHQRLEPWVAETLRLAGCFARVILITSPSRPVRARSVFSLPRLFVCPVFSFGRNGRPHVRHSRDTWSPVRRWARMYVVSAPRRGFGWLIGGLTRLAAFLVPSRCRRTNTFGHIQTTTSLLEYWCVRGMSPSVDHS